MAGRLDGKVAIVTGGNGVVDELHIRRAAAVPWFG
jgi:hypothetical protein